MATTKKSSKKKSQPEEIITPVEPAPQPVVEEAKEQPPVQEQQAPVEQPAPVEKPTAVTQEIVKALFNTELTRINYQTALDKFSALPVTEENRVLVQEKMAAVRKFMTTLDDIKKKGKENALAECRYWDNAYNDVLNPLKATLNDKAAKLQKLLDEIDRNNKKIAIEKQRVDGIKTAINQFILQTSSDIAAATTTEQIVTIEKFIGSNKANKTRYQEFTEEFIERCNELVPLIKAQKENIKELDRLKAARATNLEQGNDRAVLEIDEKKEAIESSIQESKIVIQETAVAQALRPETTEAIPVATEIKYRRKTWKWEVENMQELAKKAPHLVTIIANEEKIDELLANKKAEGVLKDTEELKVMGIRFYLEKIV